MHPLPPVPPPQWVAITVLLYTPNQVQLQPVAGACDPNLHVTLFWQVEYVTLARCVCVEAATEVHQADSKLICCVAVLQQSPLFASSWPRGLAAAALLSFDCLIMAVVCIFSLGFWPKMQRHGIQLSQHLRRQVTSAIVALC